MKKEPLAIGFFEYQKVFQILHGAHEYANAGSRPSCQFFNTAGAHILQDVYGIYARPRMGAAFIKVNEENGGALAFAHPDFSVCNSDSNHFHCWIETDKHFIDFTAPVYSNYPSSLNIKQRFMFQKSKSAMCESHLELDKNGDFYFEANLELTKAQLRLGAESTQFLDFAEIAKRWSQFSKKSLQKEFRIQSSDGPIITLKASSMGLEGVW